MNRTIENKIRLNVLLIYIVTILLCGGIALLFYYNRNNIQEQKMNIETQDKEMSRIKELVNNINTAQQEANMYISTKRTSHLKTFRYKNAEIKQMIDTIQINNNDSIAADLFRELKNLLNQKEKTVFKLKGLFANQDISDNLKDLLKSYETDSTENKEPITFAEIKTVVKQDTIVKTHPPKKFWKKLSGIFSADKQTTDTVITSYTETIDTVKIDSHYNPPLYPAINELSEIVKKDYESRILSIEKQVTSLITLDHSISSRISTLLIDLYNNLIDSRINEIRMSEYNIRRYNTMLITGGLIALFLILLFIILIINNVNKGLRMRKSLEKAQIHTKELMESRHKLLLSVSHDIKTPLNSIIGYLELNSDLNQLTSQDQASIRNSGKYILSLLDNVLNFSSLEQGKLNINTSTFHVYDFCEEIKEMFVPLARHKKLEFNHSFDFNNNLRVTSDPLKLKQIIVNILSNAIKYTNSGYVRLHVRFENEKLYFTICDTGTGIPREQIENIFKPFTRINKKENTAEGSGFGLYVVKGLSDLLGGHISVESSVNEGTSISIKIPAPAAPERKKSFAIHHVWIIDDDPSFLKLLSSMFTQLGIAVTTSNQTMNPDNLKKQNMPFDMVLTDMEMGEISGIDILYKIRKDFPNLPVYVMTGRSDFNRTEALKAGFDGYLPKPITISMLADLTERQIKKEDQLSSLREMFDDDEDIIRDILQAFLLSTDENTEQLQQYINESKFTEAQTLCHKMMPMFLQTGMHNEAGYLKKMDSLRGETENSYPEWKKDGVLFINNTRIALNNLRMSNNI